MFVLRRTTNNEERRTNNLITNQRMNRDIQLLSSFQEIELDHHGRPHDRRAEFLYQRGGGGGGAAGGQDVVDDDDAVVRGQGVVVDLQNIAPVFELVLVAARRPRQ